MSYRYAYQVTLMLTSDTNEEPAVSEFDTYSEASEVISRALDTFPSFEPTLTITRVRKE